MELNSAWGYVPMLGQFILFTSNWKIETGECEEDYKIEYCKDIN